MALSIIGKIVGPLAVAGITAGVGFAVNLTSRVSAVEVHSVEQSSHIEHVEKRLETVDSKVDRVLEGMGRVEGKLQGRKR
jgi:hypothetical protein